MQILSIQTALFHEKEKLIPFLFQHLPKLHDGDIVAVTSKIVALAQGRVVPSSPSEKKKWLKKEGTRMIKTPWCFVVEKDGRWCANAGIDESNANGQLILLPKKPFTVAESIQKSLRSYYHLKRLGVIVTDTRSIPLRAGTIGSAVGYAGFGGLKNYIGKSDLFGRKIKMTKSNVADALSGIAVLAMGEGDEQTPLVIIRNASVEFTRRRPIKKELLMSPQSDIYREVFLRSARASRKRPQRRRHSK